MGMMIPQAFCFIHALSLHDLDSHLHTVVKTSLFKENKCNSYMTNIHLSVYSRSNSHDFVTSNHTHDFVQTIQAIDFHKNDNKDCCFMQYLHNSQLSYNYRFSSIKFLPDSVLQTLMTF